MTDNLLPEKYLSPNVYAQEDETMVSTPRTPKYERELDDDDFNQIINNPIDPYSETDDESPPASQLEPRHKTATIERASKANGSSKNLSRHRKSPLKTLDPRQSRKRNYKATNGANNNTLEYKISKTQDSIQKLDKHLKQKTCPKSLRYTARANITPDEIFSKEINAAKLRAEQDHVNALKRLHQRRLESHAKKLNKAKAAKARSNTDVISRNEFESPSANSESIVNTNDVNKIEHLEKQIADLKDLLCTHLLKDNKTVESYYSVFPEKPASTPTQAKLQRLNKNNKRKQRRKHTTQRRIAKERESNEKYIKNLSDTTLTTKSVSYLKGSNLYRHP